MNGLYEICAGKSCGHLKYKHWAAGKECNACMENMNFCGKFKSSGEFGRTDSENEFIFAILAVCGIVVFLGLALL